MSKAFCNQDVLRMTAFAKGPLAEGMQAAGLPLPDDLKVTPVLTADGR